MEEEGGRREGGGKARGGGVVEGGRPTLSDVSQDGPSLWQAEADTEPLIVFRYGIIHNSNVEGGLGLAHGKRQLLGVFVCGQIRLTTKGAKHS